MDKKTKKGVLLVALGGNALIKKGQLGTVEEQFENLKDPIRQLAHLSRDYHMIITHGNGPQVGNLLLQQELSLDIPKFPLEILVAQTQGQVGYMIESSLDSELMALGIIHQKPLVSLITYVVVDPDDPGKKGIFPQDPCSPRWRRLSSSSDGPKRGPSSPPPRISRRASLEPQERNLFEAHPFAGPTGCLTYQHSTPILNLLSRKHSPEATFSIPGSTANETRSHRSY